MSKIKIQVTIENSENHMTKECDAILEDHKIKYQEDETTMVIFDYEKNILLRETEKLRMKLLFEEERIEIEEKELQRNVRIPMNVIQIMKNEKDVTIEYEISNGDEKDIFHYRIEEIK